MSQPSNIFLLPDLTHTEVTIMDRLNNIDKIDNHINTRNKGAIDPRLIKELFIERLRAFTMDLYDNIKTPEVTSLYNWATLHSISSNNYPESLIDAYVFYSSTLMQEKTDQVHFVDIINYYNSIVPLLCRNDKVEHHFVIDMDYLIRFILNNLYNEYKTHLIRSIHLIDALYKDRPTMDLSRWFSNTNLVSGFELKITIDQRMSHIDTLKSLFTKCSEEDFGLLCDHIFIEEMRVYCMNEFIEDKLVGVPVHPEFVNTINKIEKIFLSDKRPSLCYIIEYMGDGKLAPELYPDVFDMIKYYNLMHQKCVPVIPIYNNEILDMILEDCLLERNNSLLLYLQKAFRIYTIEEIIN